MHSTNLFIVKGYTGAEAKAFDGGKIARVSVATNRAWTDRKTGEKKEAVDWVTLSILNEKTAKWAVDHIKKGDPIYAECRVADRSYEKDGKTIYTTDIIANTIDRLTTSEHHDNDQE